MGYISSFLYWLGEWIWRWSDVSRANRHTVFDGYTISKPQRFGQNLLVFRVTSIFTYVWVTPLLFSALEMSEKWSGVHYSSGWRFAMLAIANTIRRIRSAAGPSQWCFFKWSSGDQTYKTTKLSVQRLFVTCLAAETLEMNWQRMMKVSEALLGRGKDPPVRGSKTSGEN